MLTIACYNIKGGVGKTATAVNVAFLAAQSGARVLIWDLDPQGAASFYYRIKLKIKGGVHNILQKKSCLDEHIKGTDYQNLDLLPADFSYRNMDILLDEAGKPQRKLGKIMSPLSDEYDLVFIDCAPSISLVTESVFGASSMLLIPTIPTTLSIRTLQQIVKYCKKQKLDSLSLLPFFSMVDMRRKMHRDMVKQRPHFDTLILQTYIPYTSEVERMGEERRPLHTYAGTCPASEAYLDLWKEINLYF